MMENKTPRTDALNRFDNPENQSLTAWVKLAVELETALSDVIKALREEQDAMSVVMGRLSDVAPRLHPAHAFYDASGIVEALDILIARERENRTYAEAGAELIRKATEVLQRHIVPDMLSDHDALTELYGIFDGPEQRAYDAMKPDAPIGPAIGNVRDRIEALMREYRLQHHPKLAKDIEALFTENSQGNARDTVLLDWLEKHWPVTNIDVHLAGEDASLGLTFDDGKREGTIRGDNLRDLLFHLRAYFTNEAKP